jgi:hypothetical protein
MSTMRLPRQSRAIERTANGVGRNASGVRPQNCWTDCMQKLTGVSSCQQAFQTGNLGDILTCLIQAGSNLSPVLVGTYMTSCGLSCI